MDMADIISLLSLFLGDVNKMLTESDKLGGRQPYSRLVETLWEMIHVFFGSLTWVSLALSILCLIKERMVL